MRALAIAIGNPLRRDDGVAHAVPVPPGFDRQAVLQLTPEMAAEIAAYETVVFIDADVEAERVQIEAVDSTRAPSLLAHVARPAEIVALSRALFAFAGAAYTCRIPVLDLSGGEGLSPFAANFAQQAGREIYKMGDSHENPRCHSVVDGVHGLGCSR